MDGPPNKAKSTVSRAIQICLESSHLRRTLTIAFIVGTWLTLLNQGGTLLAGAQDAELLIQTALNYLTPFVVSNLGLLARD